MQNQKGNTKLVISFIIVIAFVGLVVYTLANKKPESALQNVEDQKQLSDLTQTNTMEQNVKILNSFTPVEKVSSLQKIDTVSGTGAQVKTGDTVSVHYTGAVASTGEVFQSSKDFGTEPVTFPLGSVIKGWTEGIPGMKVGGTRRLVIPAEMAYGSNPPPGSGIPANADLVFDVELVSIK
jgi:FKBP-type peptidyl-prolyl cis-trans isomerase